ncbi:MAG TPA: glycosyltransferase [Burkholderiales bacterium]|nr:glycosyltransferase [Burkholderiales bacterium]
MKISIVVPAFNEERLLADTLLSIRAARAAFDARGWASELIVCDNNSTDSTAEIARAEGAAVVFEPINQIARARNAGAARARGDWLVFVDADSQPSLPLFDDVAAQIEAGRCLAGGSTVALESDRAYAWLFVRLWNALSRLCKWGAGSFVFCDTGAFREIGGFSQTLYAAEEIDLFARLKRLARSRRRTVVILHRNPLVTSGRKLRLYSVGEQLAFLLKMALSAGRSLRNRDACFPWYDGRR